jgi:hypothetical protein
MDNLVQRWIESGENGESLSVDGLIQVRGYRPDGRPPEEVIMMERASTYGADAVFFEAERNSRPPLAQAFIFVSGDNKDDSEFAQLHKRLWNWGGVPLVYRLSRGIVQLFRCAHKPDFVSNSGELVCCPVRTLKPASAISTDPWWNFKQLRNGTIWDDPKACKILLSAEKSAHRSLIEAVKGLSLELNKEGILPRHLRRKLLILSLLIAYLEEREVFEDGYLDNFLPGARRFFQVLADGKALVELLDALEVRFNGSVFSLTTNDRDLLTRSTELPRFARLVEGQEEPGGQKSLWRLYSFKDLPVELISHVYQLFVNDKDSSVYTPPFLVRLMLEEALSWERLDHLEQAGQIILDPCCGSGVFLVESYKRLNMHWRSRNQWRQPDEAVLKTLLSKVHGIDLEEGAVELAAFSLYLALCDALEPEAIRSSIKLFPPLIGKTLHHACFFEAKEKAVVKQEIGVVVGNPPFASHLSTPGAERSYNSYALNHGPLPDKQLAYLFLHEAMGMLVEGGLICLLQQYNFLYNQQSLGFRRGFISKWDVREVLDFISVRGLFQKGNADTKVIVVVAEAMPPPSNRKILHATFRRSGRTDAEQGFDIDYYDLHWLPRELVLMNDGAWRADLFGGGRVLGFVDRLKKYRTLGEYAKAQKWDFGEGFIEAKNGKLAAAEHITGKRLLPSTALSEGMLDRDAITIAEATLFKSAYTSRRFTPPMLLIREHMDIPHHLWTEEYLTYTQQIVGFCAPGEDTAKLIDIDDWLASTRRTLKAFIAVISPRLFAQKATALQADDIFSILYPASRNLEISPNEEILIDDIVDYYRDLIRLGEDSVAMKQSGHTAIHDFAEIFTRQINTIYKSMPLHPLAPQTWPGVICQPFVFGKGQVDWYGSDELKGKLDALLRKQQGTALHVTRIARIYDEQFIFLLKPDRLRYWLRSVALRDADEIMADLRAQGF